MADGVCGTKLNVAKSHVQDEQRAEQLEEAAPEFVAECQLHWDECNAVIAEVQQLFGSSFSAPEVRKHAPAMTKKIAIAWLADMQLWQILQILHEWLADAGEQPSLPQSSLPRACDPLCGGAVYPF